jgi:hypothetical protein
MNLSLFTMLRSTIFTDVGFEDPYINCCTLPEPEDRIMPALLGSFGGSGKCTLDGMDIDCGWAMEMLENGSAVQCPDNDCGPRTMDRDPVTGEFLGLCGPALVH